MKARPVPRRELHYVKAYMSAPEKARVAATAGQLKLSVSEFVRSLALGYKMPPGRIEAATTHDLMRANADQARLGNLLRLEIETVDGEVPEGFVERAEALHDEIRAMQERIKACVRAIAALPSAHDDRQEGGPSVG